MAIYKLTDRSKFPKKFKSLKQVWYYRTYYTDIYGNKKQRQSKHYESKSECEEEERRFLLSLKDNKITTTSMTFKDLYLSYYEYQSDKVRASTMKTYRDRIKYFKILDNVKVQSLSINHFEVWKKSINEYKIQNSTKNDILKLFKAILNYGSKMFDFNFNKVYRNINNFNNPNEIKKEMLYYELDEYQKFISVEDDIVYRGLFNTLYFMGLRKGELRALTWKDIDFKNKTININKQIPSMYGVNDWKFTPTKNKKSERILPMNNIIYNDLNEIYEINSKYSNFNKNWFVFRDILPIAKSSILDRKKRNVKLSGVKYIRTHDFRHSCASLLINNGANVVLVSEYLGHSDVEETLNTYSHMFKSRLNDVVNLINQLSADNFLEKK